MSEDPSTDPKRGAELGTAALAILVIGLGAMSMWFQFKKSDPGADVAGAATPGIGDSEVYTNGEHPPGLAALRPKIEHRDGYIGSESCRECHEDNHESWHHSYHRTMTQVATSDRVMADFNDVEVLMGPKPERYQLSVEDGLCWVEMGQQERLFFADPDIREKFPIVMTTGSHHMQAYWFPLGAGRTVGLLPIVYWKEAERWIPRTAAFLGPHADTFNVEPSRWNTGCIHCHSTHGESGVKVIKERKEVVFDTRTAELGISCEACHGPAEKHVALHRDGGNGKETIVNPADLSHELSTQVCGGCHSINQPTDRRVMHVPGEPLSKTRTISRRNKATTDYLRQEYIKRSEEDVEAAVEAEFNGSFWKDGMTRIVGREYNSMLDTSCHTAGELSCLSCHKMHKAKSDPRSFKEWADDQLHEDFRASNQACTQCHTKETFATEQHTHHASGSSGSVCYNCHMPHTSYGLLKAVRTHTITSPTVKESTEHGRPNACNLCHLDKTLEWTSTHLTGWYGQNGPELTADQKNISAAAALVLEGDAAQRALIAWAMGWEPAISVSQSDWMTPYLAVLMEDSYDAVRYIAQRSVKRHGTDTAGYDFLHEPAERTVAVNRIRQNWSRAKRSPKQPADVLIGSEGLQQDELDRLLARRDNRRIILTE
jgi:hypothetical protein